MKSLNVPAVTPAFDKSLSSAGEETLRQISLGIHVSNASSQMAAKFRGDN
jgi:hypothetical protein